MTMLFDPVPRRFAPAAVEHFRATIRAIGAAAARTIETIGRLCHAFAGNLLRRYVRQALHAVSHRRLIKAGRQARRDRCIRL